MFTLANKHAIPPKPDMCSLHAHSGYNTESDDSLSWTLRLHSASIPNPFLSSKDSPLGLDRMSFGISAKDLKFELKDWHDLSEKSFTVPSQSLRSGFCCFQWEDLISLQLSFGCIKGTQIEIHAQGTGSVESAADWFMSDEVEFDIHTWVTFSGVGIHVPLNAKNIETYGEARLKTLLPGYQHFEPEVHQTKDNSGQLLAVELCYPPSQA